MGFWEHFEHGDDIGLYGVGRSMAEAFAEVGQALTALVIDPETVPHRHPVAIECIGTSAPLLLYDWVNTLIREMDTRAMLFSSFEVTYQSGHLGARVWGDYLESISGSPSIEPKGATLNDLSVSRQHGLWAARCIVDV